MEKKFYIYDDQGNPSSQGFTADEIKGKGLNPNTIVCPEFGQPNKVSDFQELAGWAPPKLDEKKRKSILSGKARTYVMAAAVAVSGGGGAMYVYEKQAEKEETMSKCFENRRRLEIRRDSLATAQQTLNTQIEENERDINRINSEITEFRNKAINLSNEIPVIEGQKQQTILNRDKAAGEYCILQTCIDRRAATVARFNNSITSYNSTIASYRTEIQQIEQINIPELERRVARENTEITQYRTSITELGAEARTVTSALAIRCEDTNDKK